MRYLSNIFAIILAIGILISPSPLLAEDTVAEDTSGSTAVAILTAAIIAPTNNATIQPNVATTFTAAAAGGEPPYAYTWDFGDGTTAFGQSYDKIYATAGAYNASLVVTDFSGARAVDSINLTITAPPPVPVPLSASITAPADNSSIEINKSLTFTATAAGGESPYTFTWAFGDTTTGTGASLAKTYTATGAKIITLTAKDAKGQEASASVTVTVTAVPVQPGPDPVQVLTISNIRVTDITTTSAIVRWTTSKTATSRVIYDTVAHASVAGQTAPNFGYASSTGTSDADTKVTEHAVTVSNLSPATNYYFRVISQ